MFAEELADLKDRYPARLHLVHVLSREPQDAELLSGRIDADRLERLLDSLVPADSVDEWFLCGPYGMVIDAKAVLGGRGVPDDRSTPSCSTSRTRRSSRRAARGGDGPEATPR